MSLSRNFALAVGLFLLSAGIATSSPAERITIGGTGAATALLQELSPVFMARTGIQLEVVPSLGSTGALRAAGDGALDIAVSGRSLRNEEVQKGLKVAFTLKTPFVFVTSSSLPQRLTVAELVRAYNDPTATWPDGTPLRPILRPKSESDTQLMATLFPGLGEAQDKARRRSDVPSAATDQDNAELAERTPGSLAGMTYLQAVMEKRNLRFIAINGIEPSLGTFERGTYGFSKDLAFVVAGQPKPAVGAFLAFVESPEGAEQFRRALIY